MDNDYNEKEIERVINDSRFNDRKIADKLNNHYKRNGLPEIKTTPVRVGSLQGEGAPIHIFPHEIFGLAGIFDCFGTDFVDDQIKNLGSFEVKIITFSSGLDFNKHLLELEKDCHNRVGLFPLFPVYPYRPISPLNKQPIYPQDKDAEQKAKINSLIDKNIDLNNQRLEHLKKGDFHSNEYYPIDAFIKFLFCQYEMPLSLEQKIDSLQRMLSVFDKGTMGHCYFYTSQDYYQRQFPIIEIFESQKLVYLNLPIRSAVLAIKNENVCSELRLFFAKIGQQKTFKATLGNPESVQLLKYGLKFLKEFPTHSFHNFANFCDNLPDHLNELIKISMPHLYS